MEQYRFFFDMDGTLFKWNDVSYYERLYEEGYFRNLEPNMDLINIVNELITRSPNEVFIASKYLDDSKYAKKEKIAALKEYMPDLKQDNIILIPNNDQKINYIPGGVGMFDILIDDYSNNLFEWEQSGGVGVKFMNGINHTKGSWEGLKTSEEIFSYSDLLDLIKSSNKYKMSQEDYLVYKGVSSPISDYLTDKLRGNRQLRTQRGHDKFKKEATVANIDYHNKRAEARKEYQELVNQGLLKPKSEIDKLMENARGHEDLAATHAARRMLVKHGVDWQTGEELIKKDEGKEKMSTTIQEENKVILTFIGRDYWNYPTYKVGDTATFVKDINLGNGNPDYHWCSPKSDPDGEPDYPFITDKEIKAVGFELVSEEDRFKFMMLSRLQSDCKYYLEFGNRAASCLPSGNEEQHIARMKEIFLSFHEHKKPEWITMEDIEDYERQMCNSLEEEQSRSR